MRTELCFSRATQLRFEFATVVYFIHRPALDAEIFVARSSSVIEDLSRYHHPVGNLFARSGNSVDWDRYRLRQEKLAFFRENACLKGGRLLIDDQVEALDTELEQIRDPEHAGRHLCHQYEC